MRNVFVFCICCLRHCFTLSAELWGEGGKGLEGGNKVLLQDICAVSLWGQWGGRERGEPLSPKGRLCAGWRQHKAWLGHSEGGPGWRQIAAAVGDTGPWRVLSPGPPLPSVTAAQGTCFAVMTPMDPLCLQVLSVPGKSGREMFSFCDINFSDVFWSPRGSSVGQKWEVCSDRNTRSLQSLNPACTSHHCPNPVTGKASLDQRGVIVPHPAGLTAFTRSWFGKGHDSNTFSQKPWCFMWEDHARICPHTAEQQHHKASLVSCLAPAPDHWAGDLSQGDRLTDPSCQGTALNFLCLLPWLFYSTDIQGLVLVTPLTQPSFSSLSSCRKPVAP